MTQRIWNNWRRDEYAKFYHPDPPWKPDNGPSEELSALPLPQSGTAHANSLSRDMWLLILEELPVSILLRPMSLVSKDFRDLCMSILYRKVDISLHHYRREDVYGWYPPETAYEGHHRPERVSRQHCRFVRQLLKTPEYGNHIRLFSWTMDANHVTRSDLTLENECKHASNQLRMFRFLQNVTKVDIDGGRTSLPVLSHSASFFPNAHHVRLGGLMQWSLASAILHGKDKAPLQSLTIYNLLECGHLHDGSPYAHRIHRRSRGQPELDFKDMEESWPEDSPPIQVRPGCMRRLLTAELVSRCRNLDTLYLRKQGQQHIQQQLPSDLTSEDDVYHEWASFIAQVQPRHLRVEHGGSTLFPWKGGKDFRTYPRITVEHMAPMDARFRDILAPVLSPGWDGLQTLEIHGVCDVVTQLIVQAFHRRVTTVTPVCDSTVTWCWNAEVSHSPVTSTDEFIGPPVEGRALMTLEVRKMRDWNRTFLQPEPWTLELECGEYHKEQDRMAKFLFEEGVITEGEMEMRVNRRY
ncbi:hypothetical protein P171DRAFT_485499 [Karstenula rhodostoma CBS 690.94]|uniref:F-box domain-containing protein n=1 Tax=Karstenula rhodostoma CBS 690.94 TaxID=1392251 RepID=A0A9P4PH38_9PLEO|nr:hypothetical protein P171DRAFT_485499 [Karstenula rhodostoma CBS 690.94]